MVEMDEKGALDEPMTAEEMATIYRLEVKRKLAPIKEVDDRSASH